MRLMLHKLNRLSWIVRSVERVHYHKSTLLNRLKHRILNVGLVVEQLFDLLFVVYFSKERRLVRNRDDVTLRLKLGRVEFQETSQELSSCPIEGLRDIHLRKDMVKISLKVDICHERVVVLQLLVLVRVLMILDHFLIPFFPSNQLNAG